MQQTTMAHVHLHNKPAHSAHVPQKLKYNFKKTKVQTINAALKQVSMQIGKLKKELQNKTIEARRGGSRL